MLLSVWVAEISYGFILDLRLIKMVPVMFIIKESKKLAVLKDTYDIVSTVNLVKTQII